MTAEFYLFNPGETVHEGRYIIVDGLSSGAYSEVYLVERTDPKFRIRHALKIPLTHEEVVQRGEFTENVYNFSYRDPNERLYKEANMLAELHHPGIVKPLDIVSVKDGRQGLLLEWLIPDSEEGETLTFESFIERQRKRDYERFAAYYTIKAIIRQTTQIADYLRAQDVIHGDIKPGNMVLRRVEPISDQVVYRTYVVLIDFEFAHKFKRWDYTSLFESIGIPCDSCPTASNSIPFPIDTDMFGTLRYSPPERFTGRVSPTYDLWAIGMIYYEALTGKHLITDNREELTDILKRLSIDHRSMDDEEIDTAKQRRKEFKSEVRRKIREIPKDLGFEPDEFPIQPFQSLESFIATCTDPESELRANAIFPVLLNNW